MIEAYALLLASLLLVGGSLGDLYGRRRVYLGGMTLFAAASIACGLAPTIHWLIAARGVQGVGAALLVPGSLALISASFPEAERGRAIGTWSGFTAMMGALGPIMGGWLVQHASWRWVFFLNLPLAVIVLGLTLWRVPESRNEHAVGGLDLPGAALVTVGLGGVTFALIEAQRRGVIVEVAWGVGLAGLLLFLIIEARSSAPMVPLSLFRSRAFRGANLITFFLYGALSGALFFLPLDLIQIQHYSATKAGAALLPLILLISLLSRWSGGLIVRYGARLPLTVGPLIVAAGLVLLIVPSVSGSYWTHFFPPIVLLGIGLAVGVAPLTTTVMNSLPQEQAGTASGVNNAVSRVGGLLAIAVLGLVLYAGFDRALSSRLNQLALPTLQRQDVDRQRTKLAGIESPDPRVRRVVEESFVVGYRWVLVLATAMTIASAWCGWVLIDGKAEHSELGRDTV